MSAHTSIEWTDATVNPIRARNKATGAVGHFCEKVSPGCAHCYASVWNERVRPIAGKDRGHLIGTGLTFDVRHRDQIEFFLDDSKLQQVLAWKAPRRIFWCDMTDMFGEWVPEAWLDQMFAVMALTPQHTHQVLTKRPERMREYVSRQNGHSTGVWFAAEKLKPSPPPRTWIHAARTFRWPLPNVWLGVSVEDQQRADERIPLLLQTPAAVRFISAEPLLESVDITRWIGGASSRVRADNPGPTPSAHSKGRPRPTSASAPEVGNVAESQSRPGQDPRVETRSSNLHWVIVGGESGPGARPLNVRWVRSLVAQCEEAGVAPFVKQLGAQWYDPDRLRGRRGAAIVPVDSPWTWVDGDRKGGEPAEWPEDLRVRQFPVVR